MKNPRRNLLAALVLIVPLAAPGLAHAVQTCSAVLNGKEPMKVKLTTSMGPITLQLDREKAPISVENFTKYVDSGHYNGTIFHRVIDGFMIQGGGFTKDMNQKPTNPPIKNEEANGLKNDKYTVAMARTGVVDSATSQFFISVKDNAFLNYTAPNDRGFGYAVFGKVIAGMDVVDAIKGVKTASSGQFDDVPTVPVVIKSVKRQ